MRVREKWAYILLAIWLILEGIVQLTSLSPLGVIMGLIALAAGILFLLANLNFVRR
jgi:hypothetical protein